MLGRLLLTAMITATASVAAKAQTLCEDPSTYCRQQLDAACIQRERVGAGAIAADDVAAGTDCAAQFDRYRECLGRVPTECGDRAPEASAACSPEDARQLYASIETSDDRAVLEAFIEACPGTPQALLAGVRLQRLGDAAAAPRQTTTPGPTPGETFRDCPHCPEMVAIPGGSFSMGAPLSDLARTIDEGPPRMVRIAPFAMGRTEVTRGEYRRFVEETGHRGQRCFTHMGGGSFGWADNADWASPGFAQTDDHPAVCVSWDDAQAYVSWLNGQVEGAPYRLPSEAEQEYTIRATTQSPFVWGVDPNLACRFANGADQAAQRQFPLWSVSFCDDGHVFTAPVGSFLPNAFGLSDTLGNVWEWAADCWSDNYVGAPSDGSAWMSGDCSGAVVRGGSWDNNPGFFRSADRGRDQRFHRYGIFGFRVARTLSP